MIRAAAALVVLVLLVGCSTTVQTVPVNVAVPIACDLVEPATPILYTDSLTTGATLRQQNSGMRADIEVLEGYVIELRATLKGCQTIGAK
ncbi:MAG: hypothetical protein Q8K41_20375 [Hydrogenophaga sp.]|nr:hypothetical protein [Hydrogenophaga sp.]